RRGRGTGNGGGHVRGRRRLQALVRGRGPVPLLPMTRLAPLRFTRLPLAPLDNRCLRRRRRTAEPDAAAARTVLAEVRHHLLGEEDERLGVRVVGAPRYEAGAPQLHVGLDLLAHLLRRADEVPTPPPLDRLVPGPAGRPDLGLAGADEDLR